MAAGELREPAISPPLPDEPAILSGSREKSRVRRGSPGKAPVRRGGGVDREVAELAARQQGVVTRGQLRALGVGERAIDHRVQAGRLHRVHQGVYAVGHPLLTRDGQRLAAVLAGGPGTVLSHRSAAELWGVLPGVGSQMEITVARDRRNRTGLVVHEGHLHADERTKLRGIPVTTVARTLLDVASVVDRRALRRAIHEGEVLGLLNAGAIDATLAARRSRRGAGRLAATLAERGLGSDVTRSELEVRFLELLADRRLPPPRANTQVVAGRRRVEADFAWPERRLIVELDGHATHATRAKFERDRGRDRVLHTAGWRVIRVTWRQLRDDSDAVIADLTALLGG